jgi:hypothetical protein
MNTEYNRMVQDLGNAANLYNFQQKLAMYKNKREPNYVRAVLNARPMLYMRVLRAYNGVPEGMMQYASKILDDVNQESSPRLLFDAMKKLRALNKMVRRTPGISMLTKPSEPVGQKKYTMQQMVDDLSKSKNLSSYGKKVILYQNQKNYAKAVVKAKALVAERVRANYTNLTDGAKKAIRGVVDIKAAKNKNASPALMFTALNAMRKLRAGVDKSAWRFN